MRKMYLLFFVGLISLVHCQKSKNGQQEEKAIPVTFSPVVQREVAPPIRTSGRIASSEQMKLSFKIGGIIDALHVDEGISVQKGEILAVLKQDEIEAQVRLARSGFEKAQRDFSRVQNLHADSVATLEQLQDAKTGLDVAESQLRIAEFNLEHARIVAPANGRILKKLAEGNELVSQGHPVYVLGREGQKLVRVGVTDTDIIRLQLGDSAAVELDAYKGVRFPATVTEIGGAPDPMNGTFEVELSLRPRPLNKKLVDGFFARVHIYPSKGDLCHIIPFEALVEADGDVAFVYHAGPDNRAKKEMVQIHHLIDGEVAVSQGLDNVDRVITHGAAYLKEGSLILPSEQQ